MENVSLTSRIVGAIVILSLGIIFIPWLLETDSIDPGKADGSPIPDIPSEISTIIFELNEDTGKFEERGASPSEKFEREVANEITNSANEKEMLEEIIAPTVPDKIIAKPAEQKTQEKSQYSWVLQVASFKDREKALTLRDKLRAKKYLTHIAERKLDAGSIWRVRIGPDLKKSRIRKIQAVLEKEMGLKGLIVRRR